jgi:hypothetical protein
MGTRLVDQQAKQIFQKNLTGADDEDERFIREHIEQTVRTSRIQDGNKSLVIDSSSPTPGKCNISLWTHQNSTLTLILERNNYPKIVYYMRHFQAIHNVDPSYQNVLDPDLTEYGFQQGPKINFDSDELDLIICSPLSRTIQTYLSLFHDAEKRERIPFMLDADLQVQNYEN